jgi:hypothetical protein
MRLESAGWDCIEVVLFLSPSFVCES